MAAVREEPGIELSRLPRCRLKCSHGNSGPACGRDTEETHTVSNRKYDKVVLAPGPSPATIVVAHGLSRTSRHVDPLEFGARKEGDGVVVRRPEWVASVLGSRER